MSRSAIQVSEQQSMSRLGDRQEDETVRIAVLASALTDTHDDPLAAPLAALDSHLNTATTHDPPTPPLAASEVHVADESPDTDTNTVHLLNVDTLIAVLVLLPALSIFNMRCVSRVLRVMLDQSLPPICQVLFERYLPFHPQPALENALHDFQHLFWRSSYPSGLRLRFSCATLPDDTVEDDPNEVYVNAGFEQIIDPSTLINKVQCTPVDFVMSSDTEYGPEPAWWTRLNERYNLTESVNAYRVFFHVPAAYDYVSDFHNNFIDRGELTILYDDVIKVCPKIEFAEGNLWAPPNMYLVSRDVFTGQQILVTVAMNGEGPSGCFDEDDRTFEMCLQFWRVEYNAQVVTHISFLSVSVDDRIIFIDDEADHE